MPLYTPGFPKVNACHFGMTNAQVDGPGKAIQSGDGDGAGGDPNGDRREPSIHDQISASCSMWWDAGKKLYVTEYVASCGCNWTVDMWGNVRRVVVCLGCVSLDLEFDDQLNLLTSDGE